MRPVYWAALVFAIVYVALDFNKLYALRYGADLGTFLQTLVNLRHGSSWNYGEWRPHLAVHDSWSLALLVPLVALFPRAETLLVVQVLAVAAAAPVLTAFARELGVEPRAANALGIAYLLTPAAQGYAFDNFSENAFVPLLVFAAALAARRKALVPALIFVQLLLGLKEDEILFVAWFAAACALWWDRRLGIVLGALAIANGAGYWVAETMHGVRPNDPAYGFAVEDAGGRISLVALLLAPYAFAPVAVGRWLLLGVPLLVEIVFMQPWNYEPSRIDSHYTAPLLAATSIAAAFGLRRVPKFGPWIVPCAIAVMLVFSSATDLRPGRWPYVVDWSAYARAEQLRDGNEPVLLPRGQEGVWAVAAANPIVQLNWHRDPHWVSCPAFDTDARAFFASLSGRMPPKLCGGVPVR
jgi:uncharacterized membrane protein